MGVENGGYQPSEEEIAEAENKLTSDQKILSEKREERTEGFEIKNNELLQEISRLELNESRGCYFDSKDHEGGDRSEYLLAEASLKGSVSGHQVELEKHFDDREGSTDWRDFIVGTIDGVKLPSGSKQVAEVFEAYYHVVKGVQAENNEVQRLKEKEEKEKEKELSNNIEKVCDELLGR